MLRKILIGTIAALAAHAETGTFTIHMILHAIGEERYVISPIENGLDLDSTFEYSDRGNKRTTAVKLRMDRDYTPREFHVQGRPDSVNVEGASASIVESTASRTAPVPGNYFTIFGPSPFAVQIAMMRYRAAHRNVNSIATLRARDGAQPIEVAPAGRDSIAVGNERIVLQRFTIANLMFGREILWMDSKGNLAAAMTFAGGLSMEAVRTEYESALPDLFRAGVAQEMRDLQQLTRIAGSREMKQFAIDGATLIDATGAPALKDSVVLVRDGRIAAVGARGKVTIPRALPVIDGRGKWLLPGLWEMHVHYSGVEFGPALLAAGITTARDCGGEFDYLVAQRDSIEKSGMGPRLLLAGLVDAGGLKAFGHVTAETPEEGRSVVRRYHAARFEQIKLYTFLAPDVIRAICDEAHKLGMTVTGHVPQALNAFQGVEAGMDQINHLNYVSTMMREPGSRAPIDVNSDIAKRAIEFFREHRTVVDPTAGWGEMASHSKDVDVATFEQGILKSPFVLDVKYRGMGGNTTADQMRSRTGQSLAVIGALHKAGVAIVPGSDTGLVGYGLHREIELYVEAGMTPMEAIQSATIVSARAMKLDHEVGTVEPGKRADLILIDADPLADIHALRGVSTVIANGRLYDPAKLWTSVGFKP